MNTTLETPYVRGSETSEAAAASITPSLANLQRQVLDALKGFGPSGATDEQLTDFIEMNPSTLRPRRIELLRKGYIFQADGTRKTRSGRAAAIWRAL